MAGVKQPGGTGTQEANQNVAAGFVILNAVPRVGAGEAAGSRAWWGVSVRLSQGALL